MKPYVIQAGGRSIYKLFFRIQLITAFLVLMISCQQTTPQQEEEIILEPSYELVKLWETDTLLINNESAVYHGPTDAIYVSCMGNSDDVVDGDGFITKINLDGTIADLQWVSGLDCPKGLGIHDNKLYAIDINQLVVIDLKTATILSKTTVTAGNFFNDLDVADNGDVFLTEMQSNEIVKVHNNESEMYYSTAHIGGLNGVHVTGDDLLFTSAKGEIYRLSKDLESSIMADSCFNADGVEGYRNGYFCSSWQGKIWYFTEGGNTIKLVDTWDNQENIGDIDVVEEKNLLLSPTLFNNKVVAYEIKKKS